MLQSGRYAVLSILNLLKLLSISISFSQFLHKIFSKVKTFWGKIGMISTNKPNSFAWCLSIFSNNYVLNTVFSHDSKLINNLFAKKSTLEMKSRSLNLEVLGKTF